MSEQPEQPDPVKAIFAAMDGVARVVSGQCERWRVAFEQMAASAAEAKIGQDVFADTLSRDHLPISDPTPPYSVPPGDDPAT